MLSVDDVCEILSAELLGHRTRRRGSDRHDQSRRTDRPRRDESRLARDLSTRSRAASRARWCRSPIWPRRVSSSRIFGPKGRLTRDSVRVRKPGPVADAQRRRRQRRAAARSSSRRARAASGRRRRPRTSESRSPQRGARVALVDADVGLRNLDIVLGLGRPRALSRARRPRRRTPRLEDALVSDKRVGDAQAARRPRKRARRTTSTRQQMRALIEQLRERFDYVHRRFVRPGSRRVSQRGRRRRRGDHRLHARGQRGPRRRPCRRPARRIA